MKIPEGSSVRDRQWPPPEPELLEGQFEGRWRASSTRPAANASNNASALPAMSASCYEGNGKTHLLCSYALMEEIFMVTALCKTQLQSTKFSRDNSDFRYVTVTFMFGCANFNQET